MPPRIVVLLALLVTVVSFTPSTAFAENPPHGHWVYDPMNIATPGFVYDVPPAGFDPLTASDTELQQWGFPPRPIESDATAYARWKRVAGLKRIAAQLTFTNIYNEPARNVRVGEAINNATAATSDNWSGYVVVGANGLFAPNNSEVYSDWIVPAAHQTAVPPTCSSTWYYSSQWAGFDGYESNDVLQAGTEADANCTSTLYSFWYEWYPFAETRVSLPVGPGDVVAVGVQYTTASPHGTAYLSNLTTGNGTAYSFNPPSGTTYVGKSAEWILERPTVSGSPADLPNYVIDLFTGAQATNGHTYLPNGPIPPGGSIYAVAMTCPPWNPTSSCGSATNISVVGLIDNFNTLRFEAEGPAY